MAQQVWEGMKEKQWHSELTAQMAREHRAIYDSTRSRDPDLAAFEAERHLRNVMAVLFPPR
jgi:DNA-binding FadR family transcriptional regulator